MKVQTKGELDWKKKELGKLHKLDILKSTDASRKPRSISTVSSSATMDERSYLDTTVYIARAVEVFFIRRAQVL
jgi:hypothetical protein